MVKKYFVMVVLLFCSTIFSWAQGVAFQEGGLEAALFKARQQNKLVFVEVYLNGCPHCAALAPVLLEKKVGDAVNPNFVSIKVEANSPDSRYLQNQKRITYPEFPLFFFFDGSGNLIHQAAPAEMPSRPQFIDEVNRHVREALTPTLRTTAYPARYAKGDRDAQFLVNYGKYAKATKDAARQTAIANDLARIFTKPADIEAKSGFHIIARVVNDYKNPLAQYFFSHYNTFKNKHDAKEVKDAGELILYSTLYGKRSSTLTADEIVKMRLEMGKLGVTAKEAGNRTLLKELDAHFRAKATPKATARLNEFRKIGALDFLTYNYLVKYFNDRATDNTYAPSAVQWVNDAMKTLKPNERNKKETADLYYEQSVAYVRMGNKVEAKKAAQAAVKVAQAAKVDASKYLKQVKGL